MDLFIYIFIYLCSKLFNACIYIKLKLIQINKQKITKLKTLNKQDIYSENLRFCLMFIFSTNCDSAWSKVP